MNSNLMLRIKWHRVTETYLYPERWWENVSRVSTWKASLLIDGDTQNITSLETSGLQLTLDRKAGLAKWNKVNQVDCIEYTDTGIMVWLPRMAEPEDGTFVARIFDGTSEHTYSIDASNAPAFKVPSDVLETGIKWNDAEPVLHVKSMSNISALWKTQTAGSWNEVYLAQNIQSGAYTLPTAVPFSETSYLDVSVDHHEYGVLHRYFAVGKPGISSGRYVWYRGTMYAPKMTRTLPWISVIAPVMHPDDIERVPSFVKWHQVEWWVYPGTWTEEAIELIKNKFPKAGIVRLGSFGDAKADIQVLRPIEVQKENLVKGQRYAVQMFDDSGDNEFARRSGWLMDRLMRDDIAEHAFIERAWRQGLVPQNPADGLPQYGFGFSFTRPPEHEHLWASAQRDVDWREHRENFPCHKCEHKAACKQALPMPYATEDVRRVPWVSLDKGDCPLPRWFARQD